VTSTFAATRIRQHESIRRQARQAAQRAALPHVVDQFEAHLRATLRQRDAVAGQLGLRQSPDPALRALRCCNIPFGQTLQVFQSDRKIWRRRG
jgi:hypothetical protein